MPRETRKLGIFRTLGRVALATAVIGALAGAPPVQAAVEPADDLSQQWGLSQGSPARLQDEQNTIDVFRAMAPATVFVTQNQRVQGFSMRATEVPAGAGTGIVWDRQGHVVTNYHVVGSNQRNTTYTVTLFNRKSYPARLIGGVPERDIAVLKIEAPASELTPVRVRSGNAGLVVGQKTIAIGNPFGLDHTLTTGVVSALGREIVGYGGITIRDMIQTDASINPGNSGGPLLDSGGFLIGMNTMIYSQTGTSAGIGFAVPVDTIRRVVPQLINKGFVERPGLGISVVPQEYASAAGIAGVVILEVTRGSPAHKAGLVGLSRDRSGSVLVGDVIVGIDRHKVDSYDDLYNVLERYRVGDEVTVRFHREGRVVDTKIKLTSVR